jgi:CheY-like chemotaxis protein
LGIGLTLVRRLTEMHGGQVSARSGGVGTGCEFVIRLPALPHHVDAVRPTETAGDANRAGRTRHSRLRSASAAQAGRRVLVVDDNVDAAESMALLLRLGGHDTRTAHSGRAGVDVAKDFRPEIVFLDIGLPGMDGYEVARHLRDDPELDPLVLVAVSGYSGPKESSLASTSAFDVHLVKPVDPAAVARILAQNPEGAQTE